MRSSLITVTAVTEIIARMAAANVVEMVPVITSSLRETVIFEMFVTLEIAAETTRRGRQILGRIAVPRTTRLTRTVIIQRTETAGRGTETMCRGRLQPLKIAQVETVQEAANGRVAAMPMTKIKEVVAIRIEMFETQEIAEMPEIPGIIAEKAETTTTEITETTTKTIEIIEITDGEAGEAEEGGSRVVDRRHSRTNLGRARILRGALPLPVITRMFPTSTHHQVHRSNSKLMMSRNGRMADGL
jgi:hypothetical protein